MRISYIVCIAPGTCLEYDIDIYTYMLLQHEMGDTINMHKRDSQDGHGAPMLPFFKNNKKGLQQRFWRTRYMLYAVVEPNPHPRLWYKQLGTIKSARFFVLKGCGLRPRVGRGLIKFRRVPNKGTSFDFILRMEAQVSKIKYFWWYCISAHVLPGISYDRVHKNHVSLSDVAYRPPFQRHQVASKHVHIYICTYSDCFLVVLSDPSQQ